MNRRQLLGACVGAAVSPVLPPVAPPVVGLDLASGSDITTLQAMFDLEIFGRTAVWTTTGLASFSSCPLPFQIQWSPKP